MATVRASCGTCGDVELAISEVQVRVCTTTATSTYLFRCPCCTRVVVKPANDRVVEALVGAGAETVAWALPAELRERKDGPPISHDDLLAFHIALEGGGGLDELVGTSPEG